MADVTHLIDLDALQRLPRPGKDGVKEWPVAWRAAAEVLFLNGYGARKIASELKPTGGPDASTVMNWIEDEDWYTRRDEYQRQLVDKAVAKTIDESADVIARHLKALRGSQAALLSAIGKKEVTAKSLEGAIASLVSAIKLEREVLGIGEHTEAGTVVNNNTTVNALIGDMTTLSPEKRREYFDAMRAKMDAESQLRKLSNPAIIEGEVQHANHPATVNQGV